MKHLLAMLLTVSVPSQARISFNVETVGTANELPAPYQPQPQVMFLREKHWWLPAMPLLQVDVSCRWILF
jgi:hypothetical protein